MSWSYNKTGRAAALAKVVKQQFADVQGCPTGSAEEAAKVALGEVAETLCGSMADDKVVTINASGSAWVQDGKAQSQYLKFELTTLGEFVE